MEIKRDKPQVIQKLRVNLKALAGLEGRVGWFEGYSYEDDLPVAYIAAIQELGSGKIPPRPFMRPTAIEQRGAWADTAARAAREVVNGNATPMDVMEKLTQQAENDVGKAIDNVTAPPLSPITIELRAMKKRDPNLKVTGRTVGIAAAKTHKPGYRTPSVNTKPLIDTGVLRRTLTHIVGRANE